MKIKKITLVSLTSIFPTVVMAQSLTNQECSDLGATVQILAEQNLAVTEVRQEIAKQMMMAVVENTRRSYEDKALLEAIAGKLDDAAVDVQDLLPGIKVYRKYCRD